ncbi:hypothetical protein [Halobacillus litoralis]|uniref:hypothetical protein n=1 Tax=Halobacillus litoralis TaxID=45668 RepID=UPI00248F6F56|nr:hypothetical protein [Halobacillus litoralis]
MFFKNDENADKRSTDIATSATFIFWCLLFLLNMGSEMIFEVAVVEDSSIMLFSGLAVFFGTLYAVKYYRKNQKRKFS